MPSIPEERPEGDPQEQAIEERETRPDLRPPAGSGDVDTEDLERGLRRLDQVIPK